MNFYCYELLLLLVIVQVVNSYLRPSQRHYQVFEQVPDIIPACNITNAPNHFIYCSGPILEAVMALRLYNDSKTFVDKPLKFSPQEVLSKFNQRFLDVQITKSALQRFVDEHFEDRGTELRSCKLNDWSEKPLALMNIGDNTLREWALKLHNIWPSLCRQVDINVMLNEDRYSLIYVPNSFIVPGGRFLEFYYWDAYFIIRGLLASGLFETARSMIDNFSFLINKYQFIPNGGRVYYLGRTQPPMFIAMLYQYYERTHDVEFLIKNIEAAEKELLFWDNNRKIKVEIEGHFYDMYQYRADSNAPRPESFREDVELVKQMTKNKGKKRVWNNIASAAESGWDFSSRWNAVPDDLSSVEISDILPVDLNAFICGNLNILSHLFEQLGRDEKAEEYRLKFGRFRSSFQKVFYVKNESGWYDYNVKRGRHNFQFYPSMAVPLFTQCFDELSHSQVESVFQKIEELGAFKFAGGIPTSLTPDTNNQWDHANGWAPLNLMVIEGFRLSGNSKMQEKAFLLAQKWILNNYRVFQKSGMMWEKYSVIGSVAEPGAFGEYPVQTGFGWSNGVILDLLTTYADRLDFSLLEVDCTDNLLCNKKSFASNYTPINYIVIATLFLYFLINY